MLRTPHVPVLAEDVPEAEWKGLDLAKEEKLRLHKLQANYGWWMPARYSMEKNMYSNVRRLGGLPSSFVGLETMTGDINNLQWEDYMNDPNMSERLQPPIHSIMEYQVMGEDVASSRKF
jgi:hypothetical protein